MHRLRSARYVAVANTIVTIAATVAAGATIATQPAAIAAGHLHRELQLLI